MHQLNPKDFNGVQTVTLAEYNLIQIVHINKHKWYLSEAYGREVSEFEAAQHWVNCDNARSFREHFTIVRAVG